MKLLAFDPGAERMGWVAFEGERGPKADPPKRLGSGHFGVERQRNKREEFQKYRLRLIDFWVEQSVYLFDSYFPDVVVSETVPPVGGNAANGVQRQLATTAITTVQAMARYHGKPVEQVAANTVKSRIGGGAKASKAVVRNGVISIMPEMEPFKKQWIQVPDEGDAFAIGLTYLGYRRG